MIRYLARPIQPDLAHLEVPATPDGIFVLSQDGKAAKAAGGRPAFNVKHSVNAKLKDLNRSLLKELDLTPEPSTAELSKTKIPAGKRFGQLVEVTRPQRLEVHARSPLGRFNRRQIAVFRLALYPCRSYPGSVLMRKDVA